MIAADVVVERRRFTDSDAQRLYPESGKGR
jgi:hypothetical protein